MSEYEQYMRAVKSGYWQNPNPAQCGCSGKGWFLSEVDTWHKCPLHKPDAPHPESEE